MGPEALQNLGGGELLIEFYWIFIISFKFIEFQILMLIFTTSTTLSLKLN